MIPKPPTFDSFLAGTELIAGLGKSTVIATFDFETYSGAGFVFDEAVGKYRSPNGAKDKGISTVGAAKYTQHPDAEVLCLAYDLRDGRGTRTWKPGEVPPVDLFLHIATGGLLEAWNVSFENWVWVNICQPKYYWPPLPMAQLRCAMAKSRAFALPGGLENAANVLNTVMRKDTRGKKLLTEFSIPHDATKTKPAGKRLLEEKDMQNLLEYCIQDVRTEIACSMATPDLQSQELAFWQCDQLINFRGVQMDKAAIENCIAIIEQSYKKYNDELRILTNGAATSITKIQDIQKWMAKHYDIVTESLDKEAVSELSARDTLPAPVRRVLEIRTLLGSSAVKKLYAMANQMTNDDRLHDLFIYHSARTGRAAGAGPQPQNLPNSGPEVRHCICGKYFGADKVKCPWCGFTGIRLIEWNAEAVEQALSLIQYQSLDTVEHVWGDAMATVSGCLRGLFIASPGHDLICSDYSAIEAVVLAALAGEEWRLDVFRTHGKIYEMSAAKITGIPFEDFEKHKAETGQHHPMRKKVGKVAELASGYQGWIPAWKQFGADEFFSEDEIKKAILAWRAASPAIVEMWGGQERNWKPEIFGIEGMAISAVMQPGTEFVYRDISYLMRGGVLYCRLPSGRYLTYHKARLSPSSRRAGTYALSYEGWNSNPNNGALGWQRLSTWGGRLVENIVQAVARDILAHAIINLEAAGYKVVLHVHDEIVVEIAEDKGSLAEFETIMSTMPPWAKDWPIKATGGWRGKRYRK